MAYAIRIHGYGGPEVLSWDEVEVGEPGPGEVRIRHTAIGVNFIDTYHRTGLYPLPSLPAILGREAAGEVDAVGSGVSEFGVGDRVAYPQHNGGSYVEAANVPAAAIVPLPDSISDEQAAAVMLKGLTAQYLLRGTFRVEAGQTILFHAAAGGVGSLACQWARQLGVTVIGTAGGPAKVERALHNGCHEVIDYTREDFVARVRDLTKGAGVPVVYDSVGRDTFDGSLDCLARRGLMVSFGQSSGPVPPFDVLTLLRKGSLYITRPTLHDYIATRESMLAAADELFSVIASGAVKIETGARYALQDAAQAHRDLEARRTMGSVLLVP
jgi:NADPH2:quinone reductase